MRFILVSFFLSVTAAVQVSASPEAIEEILADEMQRARAPGVAYAVVENGVVETGARGERISGSGEALTSETPFLLGSISKSFTALAIMQLVETGQLDLDASISSHLDVFSDSPGAGITIRQLLSHTSGYSTLQGNDSHSADTLTRQVGRIAQWAPTYLPGSRWAYSNANYYVLGALIEALSGQDCASYIETSIMAPIGMDHSFVADGEHYEGIARGHTPWFGGKSPVLDGATARGSAPAGGIIATAGDVGLYLVMMMNGQDDIITAQSKAQMMRPASDVSPFYGFGWYIDPSDNTVWHTGLTPGVETLAIMSPNEQAASVVLINSSSGMGFAENADLMNHVSAHALGLDFVPADQGGQWSRKGLFAGFVLMPFLFILGVVIAVLKRDGLRAKTGVSGLFSLWFPLVISIALAWVCVHLMPQLFGVTMGTLQRFSPDLALVLLTSAVTAVFWAVCRLVIYYTGKRAAT